MNIYTWLFRSLRFHRRMHLAMAGGAALATAVLAAALITGEALNRDLRRIALERIGNIRSAVELRGRTVDASLADRLAKFSGAHVAPVLRLPATVLAVDGKGAETRIDRVNAYGVDARFLAMGGAIPVETALRRLDGRHKAVPTGVGIDTCGRRKAVPTGIGLTCVDGTGRDGFMPSNQGTRAKGIATSAWLEARGLQQ